MNINWKIVAPLGVFVLVALFLVMSREQSTDLAVTPQDTSEKVAMTEKAPPASAPASGNVDELTASLNAEADTDNAEFADANQDLELVASDSQSINGLGNAYDETTF